MPFKSKVQRRFLFWKHPEIAKRWAEETPKGAKLPERKKRVKRRRKIRRSTDRGRF